MRNFWIELLDGKLPSRIFFVDPEPHRAEFEIKDTTTIMLVQEVVPDECRITKEEFEAVWDEAAEMDTLEASDIWNIMTRPEPSERDLQPSQRPVYDQSDKF